MELLKVNELIAIEEVNEEDEGIKIKANTLIKNNKYYKN